VVTFRHP